MTYFINTSRLKEYVHFIAKQFKSVKDNNYFWRLLGVIPKNQNVCYETVLMCDTYEELAIWSDLHAVNIQYKEPLLLL